MRTFIVVIGITWAGAAHSQDMAGATPDLGSVCTPPQILCGTTHCVDPGRVCCAPQHEELSCPMGTTCNPDGTCACPNGGTTTLAGCGGDVCGCSAPCRSHGDCRSNCCSTAGFCAPACVCQNVGKLFLGCSTTGTGYGGLPPAGGCSAASGVGSTALPLFGALAFALAFAVARRRRRAR